jgi:type IV pilus assembly protein PilC
MRKEDLNDQRQRRQRAADAKRAWQTPTVDLDAVQVSTSRPTLRARFARRKLRSKEVLWVLERLTTTESAGMPIYRALGALARMQRNTLLGQRLGELQDLMGEGKTLASAMATREAEWGQLTVALVTAGEASGGLEESIRRASEQMDARQRLRRKVRSAMFYPASVLFITVLLVTILLLFVVPRFEKIYAELGSELPSITKVVLALSNQAPLAITLTLLAGFAATVALRRWRATDAGRLRFDELRLRIPVIGSLLEKAATARVASTLSALLSAGVPLLDCLSYAGQAVGLSTHEQALEAARSRVTDGIPLAVALAETGRFPELMIQLITVGAETGALPAMMGKYSEAAAEELSQSAESLTTMIEPAMMLVIGGIVGVFLIALYLPVIELGSALG